MAIKNISRRGYYDWLIQRSSAIVLLISAVVYFIFFISNSSITFTKWHSFFYRPDILILTLISFCALTFHSWIGIWTIITDYMKSESNKKIFITLLKIFLCGLFILQIVTLIKFK
jgi:succinate dehydrogenase / fumarate reductase membrane anchor subunit